MPNDRFIEKKEIIRKCAIEIIAKEGYKNTKIHQIAEKANISVGTIYNYFKNKQEILEYIYLCECNKMMCYFDKIDQCPGKTLEKIKLFIKLRLKDLESNPYITKILLRDIIPISPYNLCIQNLFLQLNDRLTQLLIEGQKNNEIRELNASYFACLIFQILRNGGFSLYEITDPKDYEVTKEQLVSFIINAIKNEELI